jgi:hypothetical protein
MPNFTISRNLESGLLLRQSGQFVRALANEPLSSVGDGMRFPLLVQNVFRDSESASDPGQGLRENLTYSATAFPLLQVDGAVVLDTVGGTLRNTYENTASLSAGNYTIIVVAKNNDGSIPIMGATATSDVDFLSRAGGSTPAFIGANGIPIVGTPYYISWNHVTLSTTSAANGVRKVVDNSSKITSITAIGWISGHITITANYLADYLRTTGSAVTGLFPEVSQNIGAWEDITFLMEVELPSDIPSSANRLFNWGNNNTNSVRGIYSANGFVTLQYLDGGSVIFELTTNPVVQTGVKRIAMKVSSGNFRLYINGVLIGSNTSVFTPTNYDPLKLGANLTGTGNRLQGAWFREFNIVPFMSDADAQAWTQP